MIPGTARPPPPELDPVEFDLLKHKIHRERGFNCHFYKDRCLQRRVAVRMRARGCTDVGAYAALLDHDPPEYEYLLDALTINVTKFLRNPETWRVVEEEVFPHLLAANGPRRVWSAGCASGEEPYTMSILLHEWAERHGRTSQLSGLRILGTDIDSGSLAAAARAEYPSLALVETPPALRERWFGPGPPFRLHPRAREQVSFARCDLTCEAFPVRQSAIFCRNVVIYFERALQEILFQRFYEALLPGGFLVMGKVETLVGPARARFRTVNNRERIFRRPE